MGTGGQGVVVQEEGPVAIGGAMDDRDARRALYRAGVETYRDLVLLAWARDTAAATGGDGGYVGAGPRACFTL